MHDPEGSSDAMALSRWESEGGAAYPDTRHRTTSRVASSEPAPAHGNSGAPGQRLKPSRLSSRSPAGDGTAENQAHTMIALRIMVVEDEAYLGSLFGQVLEGMGFIVCAIETTEARAIAAAELCKPDIMLVDIQLADGNGISAVSEILRTSFVPHVFYSGDISGVQAPHPRSVAIQKPFRVSDLALAIERALGGVPIMA